MGPQSLVVFVVVLLFFSFLLWGKQFVPSDTATSTAQAPATTTIIKEPNQNLPLSSKVSVEFPQANSNVAKKFTVSGKAPGPWFFEASFPVMVSDAQHNKIATGIAQAQGDWMTTELVSFTADIDAGDYSGPATLTLVKDNPSGLPENDDSYSIPVTIQ